MYQDTMKREEQLDGIDPFEFDEICLWSRQGHFMGEEVWHKVKLLKDRPRGAPAEAEVKKRLVVFVDDERDYATVKRVRVALGLPEDQYYPT